MQTEQADSHQTLQQDQLTKLKSQADCKQHNQRIKMLATLTQGLQQQAAAGLISTGEAKRLLDQQALDLAYSDYLDTSRISLMKISILH